MNSTGLVAGVDSSTQSTKVEIRRLDDGSVVGTASAPHPTTTPPRSEQDPATWWQAFETAFAAAAAAAGVTAVDAISVAGQQHGMVVLDDDGEVIRPAKLWNDTETAPDAGWLRKQLPDGAPGWAAAIGSVPTAAFTATKLSWLHRSEPEHWARLAHVLLPHDWLTGRLARSFTTDRGDASGTGYWSPATGGYRWDLLAIIDRERDWTDVVPRVAEPLEVVGSWQGAQVACGTGDNMAAALGLGLRTGRRGVARHVGDGLHRRRRPDGRRHRRGRRVRRRDRTVPAARVHLERLEGAQRRGTAARRRPCRLRCARTRRGTRGRWAGAAAVPRRRADPGAAIGHRRARPPAQRRHPGAVRPCRGRGGGVQHARSARCVAAPRTGGLGGAHRWRARSAAVRQVFADLCDVPVSVSSVDEAVAAGACVQAAAVALGVDHAEVIARWGFGADSEVDASGGDLAGTAAAVRAYATRAHQFPTTA
ncbi:MAG: FGGY family carbohydrate kinase [Ilumatobacteraceae bacterium]